MSLWLSFWPQSLPLGGIPVSSGGGGPAIVGTPTCSVINPSGSTYTVPSFTATSGAALYISISSGANDTTGTDISAMSSTAGGGASGDTFTQINYQNQGFQTVYGYTVFNIHSGAYVITFTASFGGGGGACVTQVTNVTSSVANCKGTSASTTIACSSSMTPTASPAVVLGGTGAYYHTETYSVGAPYTLGASAASASNGNPGSNASLYYICTSACASPARTPTFTAGGAGYYDSIVGTIYQ